MQVNKRVCVCVTKCVLIKKQTFISQTPVQLYCRFWQQINRERSVESAPSFVASSHAGCSKQRRSNICARPSWWDYTHKKTHKKCVWKSCMLGNVCVYVCLGHTGVHPILPDWSSAEEGHLLSTRPLPAGESQSPGMNVQLLSTDSRGLSFLVFMCASLVPQLRAALYDIHDIFFEIPLGDRLALLQQDRELRAERKLRDMVLFVSYVINKQEARKLVAKLVLTNNLYCNLITTFTKWLNISFLWQPHQILCYVL